MTVLIEPAFNNTNTKKEVRKIETLAELKRIIHEFGGRQMLISEQTDGSLHLLYAQPNMVWTTMENFE